MLAALSKENQDEVLPVVVSEKRSVADVMKLVEQASCARGSAIFPPGLNRRRPVTLVHATGEPPNHNGHDCTEGGKGAKGRDIGMHPRRQQLFFRHSD
ncbi:hypothetical protein QFZ94_007389 [Paraburkholderia sp. JPY465]|uniref:hypothetical protein n=1 Tax=Paraburkholderia sp. JPY465 TaxID=3042285 RepID=UPI003D196E37